MKSKILAMALLIALTSAAAARTSWQGQVMVLNTSAGCDPSHDKAGDYYLSEFQPKNNETITTNRTSNFLSFVNRRAVFSIEFASLTPGVSYTSMQVSGYGHHITGSGTVTSISTTPSSVALSTPTLVLDAVINDFFSELGCTVTIRGAYVQRVDAP